MKKNDKISNGTIIEVYEDNFISEIKRINKFLDEYNYIGMDTEFPGTVYGITNYSEDFYYKEIKKNVDQLKLIQLGITLCNSSGEYPKEASTWQFNLKFDYKNDPCAKNSYEMLVRSGIDFDKLKDKGIEHKLFAEYFTISGLVLNPDVHWISFHGSYDFAYMLKLLLNRELPENENDFTEELILYFPNHYDIRILVQGKQDFRGGLNSLAQYLEVCRIGQTHTAGSDSLVTADVFFKLLHSNMIDNDNLEVYKNILFGIGEGADDNETILYTKFNNRVGMNNLNNIPTSSSGSTMVNSNSSYGGYIPFNNNTNTNSNLISPTVNKINNTPMNLMYPPYPNQNYNYPYGMKMNMSGGNLMNNGNSTDKNKNGIVTGYQH